MRALSKSSSGRAERFWGRQAITYSNSLNNCYSTSRRWQVRGKLSRSRSLMHSTSSRKSSRIWKSSRSRFSTCASRECLTNFRHSETPWEKCGARYKRLTIKEHASCKWRGTEGVNKLSRSCSWRNNRAKTKSHRSMSTLRNYWAREKRSLHREISFKSLTQVCWSQNSSARLCCAHVKSSRRSQRNRSRRRSISEWAQDHQK